MSWPKENRQEDKQWSTNHYTGNWRLSNRKHKKNKPGRVSSSCATGTRRVTPVKHPVITHERGKIDIVITTKGTIICGHMTQIFHGADIYVRSDDFNSPWLVVWSVLNSSVTNKFNKWIWASLYFFFWLWEWGFDGGCHW